jgi:hypothetical protein
LLGVIRDRVRRRWLQVTLRRAEGADAYRRIDLAYTIKDPWGMATDREQYRFAECNRIVRENLIAPAERVGTMLEIGCGEVCDHLTGFDVSAQAIARARQRVPQATLTVGDLFDQPWSNDSDRFDVATAFEVLIMVKDVPATLARMDKLASASAVSWFATDAAHVEPHVRAHGIDGETSIRHGDHIWRVAWWRRKLGPLLILLTASLGRLFGLELEELPLMLEYQLGLHA